MLDTFKKGDLGGIFISVALAGALLLGTGTFDISLFHNNPGGQWIQSIVDPFYQAVFDSTGITSLGTAAKFKAAAVGKAGLGANADGSLTSMALAR